MTGTMYGGLRVAKKQKENSLLTIVSNRRPIHTDRVILLDCLVCILVITSEIRMVYTKLVLSLADICKHDHFLADIWATYQDILLLSVDISFLHESDETSTTIGQILNNYLLFENIFTVMGGYEVVNIQLYFITGDRSTWNLRRNWSRMDFKTFSMFQCKALYMSSSCKVEQGREEWDWCARVVVSGEFSARNWPIKEGGRDMILDLNFCTNSLSVTENCENGCSQILQHFALFLACNDFLFIMLKFWEFLLQFCTKFHKMHNESSKCLGKCFGFFGLKWSFWQVSWRKYHPSNLFKPKSYSKISHLPRNIRTITGSPGIFHDLAIVGHVKRLHWVTFEVLQIFYCLREFRLCRFSCMKWNCIATTWNGSLLCPSSVKHVKIQNLSYRAALFAIFISCICIYRIEHQSILVT